MTSPTLAPMNATFKRLHNFGHLASIASWDQAAMMPAKGNEARAAAMAELQVLMHQTLTDPSLKALFAEAAAADLPDADKYAKQVLEEFSAHWRRVAGPPNPPPPLGFHGGFPGKVTVCGDGNTSSGLYPLSRAVASVIPLKAEPVGRPVPIARSTWA